MIQIDDTLCRKECDYRNSLLLRCRLCNIKFVIVSTMSMTGGWWWWWLKLQGSRRCGSWGEARFVSCPLFHPDVGPVYLRRSRNNLRFGLSCSHFGSPPSVCVCVCVHACFRELPLVSSSRHRLHRAYLRSLTIEARAIRTSDPTSWPTLADVI